MSQTDVQEKSLPDKGPGVGAPCAGRAVVNTKVAGAVRRAMMWEMCSERGGKTYRSARATVTS